MCSADRQASEAGGMEAERTLVPVSCKKGGQGRWRGGHHFVPACFILFKADAKMKLSLVIIIQVIKVIKVIKGNYITLHSTTVLFSKQ